MKSYIIVAALSVLTGGLSAQTSIEDVLRSVEANNKDLQANSQLVRSQKLEAKLIIICQTLRSLIRISGE